MEENRLDEYRLFFHIMENEKSRMARDIHDITIQSLIHMIHLSELALYYMDEDSIKAKLEMTSLIRYIKDTVSETRGIIYNLKPMAFYDLGFEGAVEEYIDFIKKNSDIEFYCNFGDGLSHVDEEVLLAVFRIIQEACQNTLKHANASCIKIDISQIKNKAYKISIDDDGIGCELDDINKKYHYGLEIIKERVHMISGTTEITSSPGGGFHLTVIIPMTC